MTYYSPTNRSRFQAYRNTRPMVTAPHNNDTARQTRNLAQFAAAHPTVMAWINNNPTNNFAQSLKSGVLNYGGLTDRQMAAAVRAAHAPTVAPVNKPAVDVLKIAQCIDTARMNGLNKPKLRCNGLEFYPAPLDGANAGAVYVRSDRKVYLGAIKNGVFDRKLSCTDAQLEAVIKVAADPQAAAIEYGRATGQCSCCGRTLTDPVSIAQGIGPICLAKYFGG